MPLKETLSEDVLPRDVVPAEHIYGLDLTAMQPFNNLGIFGGSQIVTIPVRTGETNQTLAILEKFLAEADEWVSKGDSLLPTPTISPTMLPVQPPE